VAVLYMVTKIMFLINVIIQVKLLTRFLQTPNNSTLGMEVWHGIMNGTSSKWEETGLFPRVSLCDFEVREMGNLQKHTVQCLLIINLLTEKVFVLLWTWYLALATFTAINIIHWFYLVLSRPSKAHFIQNHLEMSEMIFDKYNVENQGLVRRFVDHYLDADGIFLLRLVEKHADVVFTTELIAALWKAFYKIEQQILDLKKLDKVWPPPQLLKTRDEESRRASMASNKLQRTQSTESLPTSPNKRLSNFKRFVTRESNDYIDN